MPIGHLGSPRLRWRLRTGSETSMDTRVCVVSTTRLRVLALRVDDVTHRARHWRRMGPPIDVTLAIVTHRGTRGKPCPTQEPAANGGPYDITIVGAGMAGLYAAWRLSNPAWQQQSPLHSATDRPERHRRVAALFYRGKQLRRRAPQLIHVHQQRRRRHGRTGRHALSEKPAAGLGAHSKSPARGHPIPDLGQSAVLRAQHADLGKRDQGPECTGAIAVSVSAWPAEPHSRPDVQSRRVERGRRSGCGD